MLPVALFLLQSVTTGAIQGTVFDSSNAPIPGARITARASASNLTRTARSQDTGAFRLTTLPPGDYLLQVEQDGFAPVSIGPFAVPIGQTVSQRVTLSPAHVTERLEVTDQPDALQTTEVAANTSLGNDRIEETPAAGRNYLNFVLTAPGVASSAGSNSRRSAASLRSPLGDSGFSFAGMRPRNNSLSIDGVDNRDETTGGNRVAVGLEMVAEFRVSGASMSAEFGNAAGGAVNVVTRSGTNMWHGDFTYFTQNEFANARNPEVKIPEKPLFRRYQPGVSLNGPIVRDRTFFSAAFEQQWESSQEWSDTPAALVRNNRAPFPLTRGLYNAGEDQSEFSFKGNHNQSPRHAFSTRYAFSRGKVRHDVQDIDNFTDQSARGSSLTSDHSVVTGWTYVPDTNHISDLRVQWSQRANNLTPNSLVPLTEIPGVVSFGQSWRLNADRTERHVEAVEGFTLLHGRHQFTFGASAQQIHLDARIANRFGGIALYPTVADYLAAQPFLTIQAMGDPRTRFSTVPVGLWVSDRWQPRPGITVDAGLRYDYQTLPSPFPTSKRNIAPRVGLALQPGGASKWVFRLGAGLFFDRPPLAFLNDALQRRFDLYTLPDLTAQATYRPDVTFPSTYSRKLTAGLERSLDRDTTLTFEYSWVAGYHLPRTRNAALTYPPVFQLEQSARSDYQGASVSVNRRLSHELSYLFSWTFGQTNDDASDFDEQPQNPANARADWARSRQHQAHRLSASALFELPEFIELPGLDNITIAPIVTYGTGRPINALLATDAYRTGAWPISARPLGFSRNPFFTPGNFSLDIRVMKTFPFHHDRSRLQIGVESFNLTNHSNPLRLSPYYVQPSYRGVVETLNARQIQFMAQFEY